MARCALALAIVGAGGLAIADSHHFGGLRGSSSPHQSIGQTPLRSTSSYIFTHETSDDLPPVTNYGLHEEKSWSGIPEVLRGLREGAHYLKDNIVDTLLFRDTHDALESRDVVFHLPPREPLRASMMHSTTFDTGLRGSTSVAESISSALRGSYSARERLERAAAEKAREHAAIAAFLPTINFTAEASRAQRNSLASGSFKQDLTQLSFEGSVPLFTSGVNLNAYRQQKHVRLSADFAYLAEEHRVALQAAAAHINLRLNRNIENALAKNVEASRQIVTISKRLFDAGDASRTDIAIAEANLESARSELDIARRSKEELAADYSSIVARPAQGGLKLDKIDAMLPHSLEEAKESALANNPNLNSARHSARASEHNARVVRGQFGPQINAFGRYDKIISDSTQPNREDDWTVGVRLRMPLIDFATVPSIDAARHEAAEANYRALDQGRELLRQVERQWSALQSAKRRVDIARRQVNALERSLEGARREFQAGFRSVTDVLNEQVRLTRARITLEQAIHEKALASYELAFSTARHDVQNLAGIGGDFVQGLH